MSGKRYSQATSKKSVGGRRWSSDQLRHRPASESVAILLLYPAALPLLFSAIQELIAGAPQSAAVELLALCLIWGGVKLARDGLMAARAFEASTFAKPPAIPRKLFGALAIGSGVALAAAMSWPLGLPSGTAMGGLAAALLLFNIGFDPRRAKGSAHANFEHTRAANALAEAEALLIALGRAANTTRDQQIRRLIDNFTASVRAVMQAVEEDPSDLAYARKYLGLYIKGARDATQRYAELAQHQVTPETRSRYISLIEDLDSQFQAKRLMLLENNRSALDIEIDVLRHRLAQDGVRTNEE